MYNEEQKLRYMQYKYPTVKYPENCLERLFRYTEPFEIEFGKDVSCFMFREISEMYRRLKRWSEQTLTDINSKLCIYTKWCIEQELVPSSQNNFSGMTVDFMKNFVNDIDKNSRIYRKETIYGWIEELENPSDQFALLALFEGIGGKDLCEHVNLRLSDFNGNKVTLHTGEYEEDKKSKRKEILRTITVSDKLVHLAHQAAEEKLYYIRHINEDGDIYYTTIAYLPGGDLVYKHYNNIKKSVGPMQLGRRTVKNKLKRISEIFETENNITARDIIKSGRLNYIIERCKELGMTGKDYLYSEHRKEAEIQFKKEITRSSFYKTYKDYLPA